MEAQDSLQHHLALLPWCQGTARPDPPRTTQITSPQYPALIKLRKTSGIQNLHSCCHPFTVHILIPILFNFFFFCLKTKKTKQKKLSHPVKTVFCNNQARDQNNSWQQCLKEPNAVTTYQQTDKIMLCKGLSPEERFQAKSLNQNQKLHSACFALHEVWTRAAWSQAILANFREKREKAITISQIK